MFGNPAREPHSLIVARSQRFGGAEDSSKGAIYLIPLFSYLAHEGQIIRLSCFLINMADPLSGIASILAVVSALKAVEKAFRRCARNMAHAKEEVQRMGRGIAMFSDILRASQENLEKVPYGLFRSINARRSTKELLRECKRTIDQFWKFLRKLKPLAYDAAPAILSEIVAKWKWSSRKEEGRDLQSSLKGLEGSLAVWNSTILVNRKLAKLSREPADEELKQEM